MTKALLAALALAACSHADPTAPVAADPKPEAAPAPPIPVGRWTSQTHCLVILENGDFELADKQSSTHGKTLVYGRYTQIPHDDGLHFDLAVDNVWQARWVSNCRKHVAGAQHLAEFTTAGVTWKPGLHQKVRIAANDGGQELDVCIAKECLTLHKDDDKPLVDADWRIPDADVARLPLDVPRRVDLHAQHTELAFRPAKDGDSWPRADAETQTIEVLGHDRFRVTLAPALDTAAAKLALWGTPIVQGAPIVLALHRLAGERLEVCRDRQCAIYTRRWDADAYDLR